MYKYLWIVVITLTTPLCAWSQDYPIQKYTPHQGLVQMQVYSLLKDSRGIIWAGTSMGVSRFNGETFTNYFKKDGLLTNFVSQIKEDKQGRIWFLCGNSGSQGVSCFDGKTFKNYTFPEGTEGCATITFDENDKLTFLLIFKTKSSLFQIDRNKLVPFRLPFQTKLQGEITAFEYLPKLKSYLVQIGNKLYSYQHNNLNEVHLKEDLLRLKATFEDACVFETNDVLGTQSRYYWDGKNVKPFFETQSESYKVLNAFNHDYFFSVGTKLYFLKKGSKNAEYIAQNPPIANNFYFLNQPEGSTIWIPTEKGIWQLTRTGFRQFSEDQVPYCWGIVEDKFKNLYFENFQVSLQKFDGKTLQTIPKAIYKEAIKEKINQKLLENYTLDAADDWYYKPLKDKFGNLWFPNLRGVFRYDYQNWTLHTHKQGDPLAFSLAEDKKRNKILAGSYNQVYTIDNQKPFNINFIKDKTPFFNWLILGNVVSPKNEYWFVGNGICRYNPDNQRFAYYNEENKKSPTNRFAAIYFDWQGTLWALSSQNGVYRYNTTKDIFEKVFAGYLEGLFLAIEQIDDEHLLINNLQSVHIINLKTFNQSGKVEIKVFNQHNGFMGLEPNHLGTFRDSNGYIWITSGSILTRMNPKELDLKKRPIHTNITHVGTQSVPFVGNIEVIDLAKNQNNTTFTVESIGEDKPFRSQFSFRIKGFLDDWSDWQEQNLLMVNNLPNGEHTIEVRSRTGTLQDSESGVTELTFRVNASFYRSPNFFKYALGVALILFASLAYFWWKKFQESQKVISQGKQLVEQENKVRFLQVQTIQAQMNPHFTFNVLGTIQQLILNNDTEKANENLLKLSALIRNYLEASILGDDQTGSLFQNEIVLSREIELLKMYIEFEQLQYTNRFEYEIKLDGKLNPSNYRVPPLIIQPFVENAIKHGLLYKNANEAGKLWIHFLSLDEDTLICTVEDNGVGRKKAAELQQSSFKKYKSRGTDLVSRRVEILNEMGYTIDIKTDDGLKEGTIVTIKIGYK
jgi:ligand-binding sensor domain-containing protein